MTDFANFAADQATKNLTAFAEITRKAQTEAVELLVAAGKEASNEAAAAVQKAANDATKAAKKLLLPKRLRSAFKRELDGRRIDSLPSDFLCTIV